MIKKEFIGTTWIEAISKVKRFIDEYNLELMSINLKKEKDVYIAILEYKLGIR